MDDWVPGECCGCDGATEESCVCCVPLSLKRVSPSHGVSPNRVLLPTSLRFPAHRAAGRKLHQSVVARIQRFAAGSQLKRTVLQSIAAELLSHPEMLQGGDRDRCLTSETGRPIISAPDAACLQPLLSLLQLDKGGAVLDEEQLREALDRMGKAGCREAAGCADAWFLGPRFLGPRLGATSFRTASSMHGKARRRGGVEPPTAE